MKEHPILFSAPMVQAILEGRKTQTRRVIKPQPWEGLPFSHMTDGNMAVWFKKLPGDCSMRSEILCQHGKPGDRLWVRETWQTADRDGITGYIYRAEPLFFGCDKGFLGFSWKPSIHMPRWASRIDLEITGIRVERVQDITSEDAIREGINPVFDVDGITDNNMKRPCDLWEEFQQLWDDTNAKRGYSWESNPWVWVIEFKRVKP